MRQEAFTVFIVDDDASIRRALKRLLRSVGYHAEAFESAEEFLDAVPRKRKGCLVLDIRLPGMTGLDCQERLKLSGEDYPIIFMTAHDNPDWQERANKTGAIAYLKKPFREEALLDAIQAASEKKGIRPART